MRTKDRAVEKGASQGTPAPQIRLERANPKDPGGPNLQAPHLLTQEVLMRARVKKIIGVLIEKTMEEGRNPQILPQPDPTLLIMV